MLPGPLDLEDLLRLGLDLDLDLDLDPSFLLLGTFPSAALSTPRRRPTFSWFQLITGYYFVFPS